METQPQYYILKQQPQQEKEVKQTDYLSLAKYAGGFAGLFILIQIVGILSEIFVLNQRLLDPDEKGHAIWMIVFYVIKNAYAMVLLGTIFIMTPGLCHSMKLPSWLIIALQSFLSIKAIIAHWKGFKHPEDPESMENVYELMQCMAYCLEYIVFLNMIIPFMKAINNPPTDSVYTHLAKIEEKEEQQKIEAFNSLLQSYPKMQLPQMVVPTGQMI